MTERILAELGITEPMKRGEAQVANDMFLLGWYRAALQYAEFPLELGEEQWDRTKVEQIVADLEERL